MKPFIVIPDGFDKKQFESLCKCPDLEVHPKSKLNPDELKALLPKVNCLIIRSATTVNKEIIDQAPNLKYVIRAGEGTDNIDKIYCKERGIKVSNTPGANSNSAAEHAIAMMFTVLRYTAAAHQTMKEGKWDKAKFTGNELTNKTVGVVGFGQIGKIVAKRISGFDPKVLVYDPQITSTDLPYAKKVETLEEVFEKSDIITLHLPKNAKTTNLITSTLLNKMKSSAILINCARGGIVNEADLYEHLKANKIRGAGFDVFANEPLEAGSKLVELDNIVMTPHLGASTNEAQDRVGEIAVHIVKEFFINNNLMHEVLK